MRTGISRTPLGTAPVWVALAATLVGLGLAFLLKQDCTDHAWDGYQYRRLCYNDIQPLFHVRGIGRDLVPYRDVQVEYPVLTGTFMYVSGRLLRAAERAGLADYSDGQYFLLSAILLAPFALWVTLRLRGMAGWDRLLLWAAGPPMVLYAFHNWDLLAVAGAAVGLAALERGRNGWAGAALALGASAKLYPAFLAPGALLSLAGKGDRAGAGRLALGFGIAALVPNALWMLVTWEGWIGVWTFHAGRYPDFGTVWFWIAHHGRRLFPASGWDPGQTAYRDFVTLAGALLFAAGAVWFLRHGRHRLLAEGAEGAGGAEGTYPVAATGLGIVCVFLSVSKVHSPQYALWIVPFLVLLDVPWRLVAAYLLADVAVYISGFYWFTVFDSPAPAWKGIFEAAVLGRAAALGGLAWWAARARRLYPRGHASAQAEVDEPPATA